MVFDITKLEWTREPADYTIADNKIEIITAPHTDLWQRTYYHFRNDNAPVLQMKTDEKFFSFVVKTEFESKHRFDQCGIVMYLDSENWLKASIEYENETFQHLGSVVTNNGYSDWATTEIDAQIKTMWYRFSRREDDYCMECSEDGVIFKQMRVCHMWNGGNDIRFGIYACSPEESSFKATFTNMEITECKWLAHEGQKPDEDITNQFFSTPSSVILMSALEQGKCEIWCDDNSKLQNVVAFTESSAYVDGAIVQVDVINSIYDWMKKHKKERYQIVFQNGVVKDSIEQAFAASKMRTEYTYKKTQRNLMDIDMYALDTIKLESYINEVPAEYQVLPINEKLYEKALSDKYLAQFVSGFSDVVDFMNNGMGYFVLFNGEIVGGVSSCARYKDNVEVQIAIHPSHRGKHLARSLGAKFVLECQKRKLYPWWDCANPTSEHIARSLGYFLKQENCTYKMQK